jgi:diacylglycerol kinase (ATP)
MNRIVRAAGCSYAGLKLALLRERAFQEELLVFLVLVIPGAVVFGESGLERAVLIGSWGNVLVVEVLNTAVEVAVDRIGTEHHPLSGQAKDLASAAVLLSIVLAFAVWALILFT